LPGGLGDRVELANASYGQAEVLVTPLQMALVAATIANDGTLLKPHLVLEAKGKAGTTDVNPAAVGQVVSPGIAHEIAAAMRLAGHRTVCRVFTFCAARQVNGQIGRFFPFGAALQGMVVAGKSGTAELGPNQQPHSWFIGFAPYDNPQVAIAVLVEHSGGGDVKASPIAGHLLRAWRGWANG